MFWGREHALAPCFALCFLFFLSRRWLGAWAPGGMGCGAQALPNDWLGAVGKVHVELWVPPGGEGWLAGLGAGWPGGDGSAGGGGWTWSSWAGGAPAVCSGSLRSALTPLSRLADFSLP